MKKIKLTLVFLLIIMLQATMSFSQGIAINDDGSDADASAVLDVKSASGTQDFYYLVLPKLKKMLFQHRQPACWFIKPTEPPDFTIITVQAGN